MKWVADIIHPQRMRFVIEPEEYQNLTDNTTSIEYKLYVYEEGRGTRDYLQEQLQWTKEFALRKFDVPLDAWRQINE